jgi:C1A family cysteine protease
MPAMGWHPDRPDDRDHHYVAPAKVLEDLPRRVDLRPDCPPVYDQGRLDACTANAIAAAIEFDLVKQRSRSRFTPARLFIYYNERKLEGKVAYDAGARLRDGIKVVAKHGAPPERLWPYEEDRFANEPPRRVYERAARHRAVGYKRLRQELDQLRGCLASGYPFVFGFSVYPSFACKRCDRTGAMPMPKDAEDALGGHAVMAVGYDDGRRRFIVRNSWGDAWGKQGYFTTPYDFVTDPAHAKDFWTIRLMS